MASSRPWCLTHILIALSICNHCHADDQSTLIPLSHSDRADMLSQLNRVRSAAAKGQGVRFGGDASRFAQSTAMESLIWDHALESTASQHSQLCALTLSERAVNGGPRNRRRRLSLSLQFQTLFSTAVHSWLNGCSQ